MSKVGNLLRKVAFKASGGVLGTATGDKPGSANTPVNTRSYQTPISQVAEGISRIGNKGVTVQPVVYAAIAGLLVLAWVLFKPSKKR